MGQLARSPSDNNVHPTSLSERLKELAERLKVEADGEAPGEPFLGQTAKRSLHLAPGPGPWLSRKLLAVLIVVSLVPTATIGVMLWQGVIRTPWSIDVAVGNDSQTPEAQRASTPSPAAETLRPKQEVEGPSVTLTVPSTIEAEAGKESPFNITLNSADPPLRSIITIQGLPQGTKLSDGRPYGDGEWTLKPDEASDLRLLPPKAASGHTNLRIELVGADGSPIASATTQLNVANHQILRPEEKELVAGLIAHGQKMIDVGYLAGARGYFKRAAEAGSADAALALGATYDPKFISDIGVKGIKGDLAEARAWYERAWELGSVSAQEKLEELKHPLPVPARLSPPTDADQISEARRVSPSMSARDVCNLIDPWQKCSFSKPNIMVVDPKITTQAAAVSLCNEFVGAVRGMGKVGQPMEAGWTLHVHSSKGELATCYLP